MVVEEKGDGVYAISDINKVAIMLCETYLLHDTNTNAIPTNLLGEIVPKGKAFPTYRLSFMYDTIRWNRAKGRPCRVVMFAMEFAKYHVDDAAAVAKEMLEAMHRGRLFASTKQWREKKAWVLEQLVKYENDRRKAVEALNEGKAIEAIANSFGWEVGSNEYERLRQAQERRN